MQPKSQFLSNLFSFPYLHLMALAWCLMTSSVLLKLGHIGPDVVVQDNIMIVFFLVLMPIALPLAKFEIAWAMVRGHGELKMMKIDDIPVVAFVLLALLGVINLASLVVAQMIAESMPSAALRTTVFSSSMIIALVLTTCRWHYVLHDRYWSISEYDKLMAQRAQGQR